MDDILSYPFFQRALLGALILGEERRALREPRGPCNRPGLAHILSICGFRYRPASADADIDAINRQILRRLARETPIVVSSTVVDGSFVLRPCFINARTSIADVDAFVDTVIRFGDDLAGRAG